MEAEWIADRAALRCLVRQHPEWTQEELANCIGRSKNWVKKWLNRLREAPADDLAVLRSRSRARKRPPPPPDLLVIQKIGEMREHPPDHLQRVPGPKAILYYLHRDVTLLAAGGRLPRSTRTVWKILRKLGCILDAPDRKRRPLEPRQPLEEVQLDFKDVTTVPPDPDGKRAHVIEVLTLSTRAPPSSWMPRCMPTSMPKPRWKPLSTSCGRMGCPACSPLIATRAWSAAVVDATFLQPCAGCCCV
jgi:transposase